MKEENEKLEDKLSLEKKKFYQQLEVLLAFPFFCLEKIIIISMKVVLLLPAKRLLYFPRGMLFFGRSITFMFRGIMSHLRS